MKSTWHRASAALIDRDDREGTVSVFADYDLANWTFGFRIEHDPCWLGIMIDIGPIYFSITYWRHRVVTID